MSGARALFLTFAKVAVGAFAVTILALIAIGMAFSLYSEATNAPVSAGAFNLQAEDLFWIAAGSIVIGGIAVIVRVARGRS